MFFFSDTIQNSAEFEKKQKEMSKAKQLLRQAEEKYGQEARANNSIFTRISEIYTQMEALRSVMLKV